MILHLSMRHGRVVSATLVNGAPKGRLYKGVVCVLGASVALTVVLGRWYEPLHLTVTAVYSHSVTSRSDSVGLS